MGIKGCIVLAFVLIVLTFQPFSAVHAFCEKKPYDLKVSREGCQTQTFVVSSCLGNCLSFQKPLSDAPFFESKCTCCSASRVVKKKLYLDECLHGVDRLVIVESAEGCVCKPTPCKKNWHMMDIWKWKRSQSLNKIASHQKNSILGLYKRCRQILTSKVHGGDPLNEQDVNILLTLLPTFFPSGVSTHWKSFYRLIDCRLVFEREFRFLVCIIKIRKFKIWLNTYNNKRQNRKTYLTMQNELK